MNSNLSSDQFSAYDERPDPKKPGQQGVLFRKEAPARGTPDERRGISENEWGDRTDARRERGRATGEMPNDGILYHGTSSRLKPGSLITPGHEANFEGAEFGPYQHGKTHDVNHEHVFATPHLHDAYRYAKVSQEVQSATRGSRRRAFVYEVQPTGPVQIDHEDEDARTGNAEAQAFQTKHPYRVVGVHPMASAQSAYVWQMEDEYGMERGEYPYSPKNTTRHY